MPKSLEQYRAECAWIQTSETWAQCVRDEKKDPQKVKAKDLFSEYVSLTEGTPATILQCGLGPTVAFYLAQDKMAHSRVLQNLASWLSWKEEPNKESIQDDEVRKSKMLAKNGSKFREWIINGNSIAYRSLTDETLEYIVWLKRFGKSLEKGGDSWIRNEKTTSKT
jgi:CRISPR type III-B/RAMP module-associated protein Cmr5